MNPKNAALHPSMQGPALDNPEEFWGKIRSIIREEIARSQKVRDMPIADQVDGLTHKPVYKMSELCALFQVSRPTIYGWIEHGKLKPFKVRSRVYFLWDDVVKILRP